LFVLRVRAGAIPTWSEHFGSVSVCESQRSGRFRWTVRVSDLCQHRRACFQGNSLRSRSWNFLHQCSYWGFFRWWSPTAWLNNRRSHSHNSQWKPPIWPFTLPRSAECFHVWYTILPTPKVLKTSLSLSMRTVIEETESFSYFFLINWVCLELLIVVAPRYIHWSWCKLK